MLINIPKGKIEEIVKKYDLKMLLLFGSRVKNKFLHQESDYDMAYLGRRDLTGKEIIDLNCDLMDLFGSDRIDLTNLKRVDPLLRYEIARKSEKLFGNEIDYLEFKAAAYRKYINHRSFFEFQSYLIKNRHKLLAKSIYDK